MSAKLTINKYILQILWSMVLLALACFSASAAETQSQNFTWPGGGKLAVSLSYDDALNSHLDKVLPALNKHHFKGSFYVISTSSVLVRRKSEWQAAVKQGHELGNHSMHHPCRASLPNRGWVKAEQDLDKYSVTQMIEELSAANAVLNAIDGKTERTYTVPCGDLVVGSALGLDDEAAGQEYLSKVNHLFTAIKGHGIDPRFNPIIYPRGETGKELIAYINNASADTLLINLVFHGVGGDYLSVSSKAHAELLAYLAANRDKFYVDSYLNLMNYAAAQQ
ncbi:polysaccharide deacetylase family protein [Shewanella sp. UCD-KL21]|uniref:polysaccharide deacetylase family protein n=1 Tax=Shewanella sp. UCD-KL21 TaxID=1917164 RepID=UPI000970F571|nr:polysaccharide deacetylase family protein [Shewanella sp. UCD-KL21]